MSAPAASEWRPPPYEVGRPPSLDPWRVGDWLNQDKDKRDYVRPCRIDLALRVLRAVGVHVGRDYLYLLALVSRAIEPERRRDSLAWSHHREVAHLDSNAQDVFLELAEQEELSCPALREVIRSEA